MINNIITRLRQAGVESAEANAEAIFCSLLGCRRIDLYINEIALSEEESALLEGMIRRRVDGEPLQYITGKAEFFGNELLTEPGVFIPRPETEILIEAVIKLFMMHEVQFKKHEPFILDLCTGTGNIAISLTKALTHCKIISSDISDEALSLAKRNALLNGVCERISYVKADLFALPDDYKGRFDVIVSNPPYISTDSLEHLPADVLKEPRAALDGGRDGLYFYSAAAKQAPVFLKENGFIALELADGISEKVKELFENFGNFHDIRSIKDLNGIDRVMTARKI